MVLQLNGGGDVWPFNAKLQMLAIIVLGLTSSALGCERNWSVFEHQRMPDLVFVKYYQKLKEIYDIRDEIDPISLNDIDDCNEWLVEELDDCNEARNDIVHEDDTTLN